jgi:hypothetical protein
MGEENENIFESDLFHHAAGIGNYLLEKCN